ncbi:MAK10-like protein [Tanacetum coccineum]
MGDTNHIRTLGDYSKPSHEGYRNTIEFPIGNNVVPLQSDTIQLVQNGCSFHGLWSEDPNQHLKDFLKLVDSLDLDGENRERMRLRLQNSAMISLCSNNIKDNIFLKHGLVSRTYYKKSLIMASTFGSKSKSFMTMSLPPQDEPLTNRLVDFAKPVKAISLPQDIPSTSDRRLIKLKNQFQCLMEAHIASMQPTQVNKITSSCKICSGPHDTQYCMENPEQAFVEYASSCTDEARGKWYTFKLEQNNFRDTYNLSWKRLVSNFMASQEARLSKFEANFKRQQSEMTNKTDIVLKAITDRMIPNDHLTPPFQSMLSEHDLHLNLPVLKFLAHAPIYNAILDKYVECLELGKNGLAFVQGKVSAKMKDPVLFTLPCRLGNSKPFDTLANLGSCVNIILLYLFKKLNIRLLEETYHIFGLADRTESYPVRIVKDVEVHIGKLKLLNDFYVIDMKKDPQTPLLVGRGFLATANAVIDCRKAKIAIGEGITRSVFGVEGVDLGSFSKKTKRKFCSEPRDGVRIYPDGVVIFDEKEALKFLGSRKAHLLEDKQIPSVGVFDEVFLALGWHLEEIYVTWAHLEKKMTRLWTYTKSLEESCLQGVETASQA